MSYSATPSEYDVKLVYLYNFTKFINWPDSAFSNDQDPVTICIMGELPAEQKAKDLETRTTKGRAIQVNSIADASSSDQCHILFLTKHVGFSDVIQATRANHPNTLMVGEISGFAKNNGEIGFILDERNRVRIEINLIKAKNKNFNIRAQLLEIARKVYRTEGES